MPTTFRSAASFGPCDKTRDARDRDREIRESSKGVGAGRWEVEIWSRGFQGLS